MLHCDKVLRGKQREEPPKTFTASVDKLSSRREKTVRCQPANNTLSLLHVDDNANERFLVKRAISITNTPFAFYEAAGLESARAYFQLGRREHEKFPRPAMVLLDYEMGDQTGDDFLHWLRVVKKVTSIPVVLFSGSVGNRHVASC